MKWGLPDGKVPKLATIIVTITAVIIIRKIVFWSISGGFSCLEVNSKPCGPHIALLLCAGDRKKFQNGLLLAAPDWPEAYGSCRGENQQR